MIHPHIIGLPLAEQAAELARATPIGYSDNPQTTFNDVGLGQLDDEKLGEFFEGKQVLDIGSGTEGVARKLFKLFGDSKKAPNVVNLNPHLADDFHSKRLLGSIEDSMDFHGEDFTAYMAQRVVSTDAVQALSFDDGAFDVQLSAWAFPRSMYDCWEDYWINDIDFDGHARRGYEEVLRTQAVGGIALLGPILKTFHEAKTADHLAQLARGIQFTHEFTDLSQYSSVLQLQRT